MENLINIDEFEKLLLINWTKFISPQKLIAFVLSCVRDSNNITKANSPPPIKKRTIQVSLSKFRPIEHGFSIWADFVVPKKEDLIIGTCELQLNLQTNELKHLQTIGSMFVNL